MTREQEAIRCGKSHPRGCKRNDIIANVFYFRTDIVS